MLYHPQNNKHTHKQGHRSMYHSSFISNSGRLHSSLHIYLTLAIFSIQPELQIKAPCTTYSGLTEAIDRGHRRPHNPMLSVLPPTSIDDEKTTNIAINSVMSKGTWVKRRLAGRRRRLALGNLSWLLLMAIATCRGVTQRLGILRS
jgi:hypothetical protein